MIRSFFRCWRGWWGEGLRNLRRLRFSHCPAVTVEALRSAAVACSRLVLLELPQHLHGCSCLPHQAPGGHMHGLKVVDAL